MRSLVHLIYFDNLLQPRLKKNLRSILQIIGVYSCYSLYYLIWEKHLFIVAQHDLVTDPSTGT